MNEWMTDGLSWGSVCNFIAEFIVRIPIKNSHDSWKTTVLGYASHSLCTQYNVLCISIELATSTRHDLQTHFMTLTSTLLEIQTLDWRQYWHHLDNQTTTLPVQLKPKTQLAIIILLHAAPGTAALRYSTPRGRGLARSRYRRRARVLRCKFP